MLDVGPYHCPHMVNVLVLLFHCWRSRECRFQCQCRICRLTNSRSSLPRVEPVVLVDSKLLAMAQGLDETNLRPIAKQPRNHHFCSCRRDCKDGAGLTSLVCIQVPCALREGVNITCSQASFCFEGSLSAYRSKLVYGAIPPADMLLSNYTMSTTRQRRTR